MSIENIPAGNYKCLIFYHYSHQESDESPNQMGYLRVNQVLNDGTKQEILNVNFEQAAWLPVKYNITDNGAPYSVRHFTNILNFKVIDIGVGAINYPIIFIP